MVMWSGGWWGSQGCQIQQFPTSYWSIITFPDLWLVGVSSNVYIKHIIDMFPASIIQLDHVDTTGD